MSQRNILFLVVLIAVTSLGLWFFTRGCATSPDKVQEVPLTVVEPPSPPLKSTSTVETGSEMVVKKPGREQKPPKPKSVTPPLAPPPAPPLEPPPVEIHKELIPKDIEIVRVYYASVLVAPGGSVEFDINGSGFTSEFEEMIQTESGHPEVTIHNLSLLTPNQIHGTLVVSKKATTSVAFPRVLINEKVVFQAPEPFAVIRPNEVLNVIFTEMGESGRTGRFRVFTNLTPESFEDFKVVASTEAIAISALEPTLPFTVDGDIRIGPAAGGEYGLQVLLDDKVLWKRDGIIRVVKPNVGEAGLVQRLSPVDEFFRPGDIIRFMIQGSGFQSRDTGLLSVQVKGLDIKRSTFTYLSPGRMELTIQLPDQAEARSYGVVISQGQNALLDLPQVFSIVNENWMRGLQLQPKLMPGGSASLILMGRDFSRDFVSEIEVSADEPQLKVGSFKWVSPEEAHAPISAGGEVNLGDYLLHMSIKGAPVTPQFGSIIQVTGKLE